MTIFDILVPLELYRKTVRITQPVRQKSSNWRISSSSSQWRFFWRIWRPKNIPRRKFPKLGISSLGVAFNFDSWNSTSDSEEVKNEDRPKTSTPQKSPSKIEGSEESSALSNQVWAELELTNQKHPLPSVEDLLYPGIKNWSSPSKFTKSSRRLLSGMTSCI